MDSATRKAKLEELKTNNHFAVAKGTNGDFYAADPQCWKIKNEITGEVLSC